MTPAGMLATMISQIRRSELVSIRRVESVWKNAPISSTQSRR